MISTNLGVRQIPKMRPGLRLSWLAFAGLVAVMLAGYVTLWGVRGWGVDFACFRAAAIVAMHGGNPYDFGQLWRAENALYNLPTHLHPGSPAYYGLNRYYNPPLFLVAMMALARLPFLPGYAVYAAAVVALAVAGTWLILSALDWTRHRVVAAAVVVASPCVFLAVRNGQQSTLVLCALGAALLAWRRGHPGLAGALLAVSWVKPHLLVPFALTAPLLLPSSRSAARWYAGFVIATGLGTVLTLVTTGAGSIVAWLHTLFGYTGYADAIQGYMPSLSGMVLLWLPHPWNRLVAAALVVLGLLVMAAVIVHTHRRAVGPWAGIGVLIATWLLFTPFAHTNDDVLLVLPLAVACGPNAARATRPLPFACLWACFSLSLALLLPRPLDLLGLVPPVLVFVAALTALLRATQTACRRDEAIFQERP